MDDTDGFRRRLAQWGIDATFTRTDTRAPTSGGVRARLTRGKHAQDYEVTSGRTVPLADVHATDPTVRPLVLATFVSTRSAEHFRRVGIQYLDTAGNASIRFGDVLIDVRGRQRPDRDVPATPKRAINLFSAGRAQVVFALLAWPRLWGRPRREVAEAAGVSLGQAQNTVTALHDAGFDRDGSHLTSAPLVDLWTAAFPSGLAQRLLLATFATESVTTQPRTHSSAVYLSGESATGQFSRTSSLVLYVESLDPRLVVENHWRADARPNVLVRRKFWTAPDRVDTTDDAVRTAPWPLVYADLIAADDPRGRHAAVEWRKQHEQDR